MAEHHFHAPRIRCREIKEADLDAILNLLAKSPFGRPREFCAEALQRLGAHPAPRGYPQYGYLLDVNGVAVGVLLVISSELMVEGKPIVRCNVSSWYVWPPFRPYGSLLASVALRRKDAVYTDLSPLSHTRELILAQGFRQYCDGRFITFPIVKFRPPYGARVALADHELRPGADLSADDITLLLDHAAYGFLSVVVTSGGRRYPFIFEVTGRFRFLRSAYLIYCRSIAEFVRFARPLGLYLLRYGSAVVTIDANGRIPGLLGWVAEATPKYFKGPVAPQLGDVVYSERTVLGLRFPATVAPEEPG